MSRNRRILGAVTLVILVAVLCLAASQQFILQLFNGSSNLGTWTNFGVLKCDGSTVTCTLSGSTLTLTSSGGGASPGGSTDAIQYNGGSSTFAGLNSPTTNCVYNVIFNVTGSAAVAPTAACPGIVPNPQTGTTYTYLYSDRLGYTTFSNASSIAVTLPQAGSTGFANNWANFSCNIGAGTVTITPTTSTISYTTGSAYTSGASSLALTTGQCVSIKSDNTNYFANVLSAGSSGITNPGANGIVSCTGTNCSTSSASTALPSTTTATTQSAGDATTKVATDAFVSAAVLQSASVVITSAQFLAMANTPATDVTIVAAQGAGKIIVPVYAVVNMNYPASGGVAYTTGFATLLFYQTGSSTHNITYNSTQGGAQLLNTVIGGSSSGVAFGVPLSSPSSQSGTLSTIANNALVMNINSSTQYTAGNSTFTVTVWYQVVSVS